jgi:glycerate dehydrogenase
MRIVVLETQPFDADGDLDWGPLRGLGDLTLYPRTRPDEAAARVAGADAVYTNKVRLGPAEFDAAGPSLRFVGVLATGYDVVDVAAARARGVTVCNVPGYSTPSTAQTAVALLLELCSRVGEHAAAVREGEWAHRGVWSFWHRAPVELDGKTLCVIGMGQVGRRVAAVASALGMDVITAALPGREEASGSSPYPRVPLDAALARADAVSLHVPLTPATRGLMDAERLALLKPGALLVNTGRGPLVDEAAVAAALRSNRLGGYAADVLSTEPPADDNPLLSAPNCLVTPHYAWASRESRSRLMAESVENLRAFLAGRPRNVVS